MINRKIIFYEELSSTNDIIKTLAENGAEDGTVVMAGMQTSGKGRTGHAWESGHGCGVYMSILIKHTHKIKKPAQLSLVTGLAVCNTVKFFLPGEIYIKWPNDVLLNGRKVSGILIESIARDSGLCCYIVGIGINVNNTGFSNELVGKATSFFIESGKKFEIKTIALKLIDELEVYFDCLTNGETDCTDEYRRRCINIGRQVRIITAESEKTGEAVGIGEDGELLVRTQAEGVISVSSGEVSVRGLCGYI